MKAAYINSTGPASVIEYGELQSPTPQPGQVLVRMEAVAVNPIDTYIRAGLVKMQLPMPYVIGCDIAGTVEQLGDGVTAMAVGDRVWGSNQGLFGRQGTFCELAAVDAQWLYGAPDNVTAKAAAAGALTGITAHLGLHLHGGLKKAENVFVNGGTGGVGSAVVQLAKAAGATVLTTVGSDEKASIAGDLGADVVINYRQDDVVSKLAAFVEQNGRIDLWFETLRNPDLDRTVPLMARRGRIVLMAGRDARPEFPVGPFYVNDLRAIGFAMFNASAEEQQAAARELNTLMETGRFQPLIGQEFSLADAAEAHRMQEANTLEGAGSLTGKIILTP
ncbi:MAG: NADPH:quinone reductase [Planctomycetaceae bacterium]